MSWNETYAEKTLAQLAQELGVQRLEIKNRKFILKDGSPVSPVPVPMNPVTMYMWDLWNDHPRFHLCGDRQEVKELEPRYVQFVFTNTTGDDEMAYFSAVFYK